MAMLNQIDDVLKALGLAGGNNCGVYDGTWIHGTAKRKLDCFTPITGKTISQVSVASDADYERVVRVASENAAQFRELPAPKRGEIIREIADEFRTHKKLLGQLVTIEAGKILGEGYGEVQEVIDIADFAVGLSRQLHGLTMHSERRRHRMYEQWHPLGNVGVITAFNFPIAVWAWNAMLAAVCGNSIIWKPSELTPLTAIAATKIAAQVATRHGFPGLFTLVIGDDAQLGQRLAADGRIPLISATGSTRMGKSVGETVGKRLGRSLLELGGNNAIILLNDANLDLALRGVLFGAVGTAGQRCTTTRRLIMQRGIAADFTARLKNAYGHVKIGNPLEESTLMGPLIRPRSVEAYNNAITTARAQGGEVICGGNVLKDKPSALYVEPTLIKANKTMAITREETFAPILYLIEVDSLDEAIAVQNDVPQGLSSAIFTNSLMAAETFLSCAGSDCGIANVNIGTSGAEIGGAFGGEKETGGGREAGSDSWKAYMRRQTNTINFSTELPLAQGIVFGN